jgi:hypothetical protein
MPYSYDPDASGILAEGVHILTVTSIEDRTSRNGDPMWLVRLEDDSNREVVEWIVQKPNIIDWKFRPLWEAAGLQWPKAAAILDEQELIDKRVQVTIQHEESEQFGRQPRIAGYAPVGEGALPGQEAFDTGDTPQPVGARYGQPRQADEDEDIPF